MRNRSICGPQREDRQVLQDEEMRHFARVKTVFGHHVHNSVTGASIYIVIFDKEGLYIISGSDDGYLLIRFKFNTVPAPQGLGRL